MFLNQKAPRLRWIYAVLSSHVSFSEHILYLNTYCINLLVHVQYNCTFVNVLAANWVYSLCTVHMKMGMYLVPWMKEVKGIRHRGRGAYLRCPVFTTVQFSLRNEGSSEYICLCEGREILSPYFQTFQDPRRQFHGIGRLVSETLYLFATLALLHKQAELILGTFLPYLKV
jgi:hypothetical protein